MLQSPQYCIFATHNCQKLGDQ